MFFNNNRWINFPNINILFASFHPHNIITHNISQFERFGITQRTSTELARKVRHTVAPTVFTRKHFNKFSHCHSLTNYVRFDFVSYIYEITLSILYLWYTVQYGCCSYPLFCMHICRLVNCHAIPWTVFTVRCIAVQNGFTNQSIDLFADFTSLHKIIAVIPEVRVPTGILNISNTMNLICIVKWLCNVLILAVFLIL